MASYMGLREGWVDSEGKVEPIEFESESTLFFLFIWIFQIVELTWISF